MFDGYQFWIADYHIHHTTLSIGLVIISVLIYIIGRRYDKPELQCIAVFGIAVGIMCFLQWIFCIKPETGALLWITKGR